MSNYSILYQTSEEAKVRQDKINALNTRYETSTTDEREAIRREIDTAYLENLWT